MNCLILSPHLDDAVLSCGATIHKWVSEGKKVTVVSVFTSPGGEGGKSSALYEKRRNNDTKAAVILGFSAVHLGFSDAPFRDKGLHSFSSLLFHHGEDGVYVNEISQVIESEIRRLKPECMLIPLGVGGHIDHNLVFRAGLGFHDRVETLAFYEDIPYALVPGWSAVRWTKLQASLPGDGDDQKLLFSVSLMDLPIPFVRNYFSDEEDRKNSSLKFDHEMADLRFPMLTASEWLFRGKRFCLWKNQVSEADLDQKCEAIGVYETEWPLLFGEDKGNIRRMLLNSLAGGYTERFWKLQN